MRTVDRGNVDRYFVCLGVLAGLGGLGMGLWMHFRESYALYQVHAHTNLVGWVTMTLFGLGYRSGIPKIDDWAVVHFWISAVAIATFPTGMVIAMLGGPGLIVGIGVVLTVASMVLFGVNVVRGFASVGKTDEAPPSLPSAASGRGTSPDQQWGLGIGSIDSSLARTTKVP